MVEVLSCVQPTAELHIGNYFGAIQNWVRLQNEGRSCIYGVVDLHAMTVPYVPSQLRGTTEGMFLDLLACGLDPERTLLFVQSLVPEHAELAWILGCVTAFGELRRMTQFKDKRAFVLDTADESFVSAGLFTYPILQAADILIYRAKFVPVGRDQQQHLELARDIARRFNERFGTDYLLPPEPLFTETPKIASFADPTKKMSKSLGPKHYIGLFEDEASIRKKVQGAVTDTGTGGISPGVTNLFQILRACAAPEAEDLDAAHREHRLKYVDLKRAVADALVNLTGGFRKRRAELLETTTVGELASELSARVRVIAREHLNVIRGLAGLPVLRGSE